MSYTIHCLAAVLSLGIGFGTIARGEEAPESPATSSQAAIQVMDVVILSTNSLLLGTNTLSLAAVTGRVSSLRESLDVLAIHGVTAGSVTNDGISATMAKLAHAGIPLVLVEKEGEYAWREQSNMTGVRTMTVGTDQLATLRRIWMHGKPDTRQARDPNLKTKIVWDSTTDTYELSGVELGLFGDHLLLMHEQPRDDEDDGSVGLEFKAKW